MTLLRRSGWASGALLVALLCAVLLAGYGFGLTARAQTTVDYDDDDDGLIEVESLAQLNAIRWDLDGDGDADDSANDSSYATAFPTAMTVMGCPSDGCTGYELAADLDFTSSTWASGTGWEPIGASTTAPFAATFDGGAPTYTISDLFINRPSTASAVGLFGYTGAGSAIRNVKLEGVDVTAVDYVGALAGQSLSPIENSHVAGTVDGRWYVGGLAGLSDGSITASTSSVTVTSNSTGGVTGGLVGLSRAAITNSHASGAVTGLGWVGGLVGWNQAAISGSSAGGVVTATGDQSGGLAGLNEGAITNSHAGGAVNGVGFVGGLVGSNDDRIARSTASGRVSGSGDNVGGLVGSTSDWVADSYAGGVVTGANQVGGLVGSNDGTITGSRADGDVGDANSDNSIGGLVGWNSGLISGSVATGDVTGEVSVGGLVGWNEDDILQTVAGGAATGQEQVGGLVGYSNATGRVIASRAGGTVIARDGAAADGDMAGGLVGWNDGLIAVSYSTGAVTGVDAVGGLVGEHGGTISATYASGSVTGSGDAVGGLVGLARKGDSAASTPASSVTASYATGAVSGSGTNIGGFAGVAQTATETADNASFTNSYWDTDTSGKSIGVASDDADASGSIDGTESATEGVSGQTTAALQTPTQYDGIFADWRVSIPNAHPYPWLFGGTTDYPALQGPTDPPAFPAGTATRTVAEDFVAGIPIGAPLTATDTDSDVSPLRYKLVGADAVHFTIDEDTGQLLTETTFDYDNPVDAGRDNTYEFMVQAWDGTVVAFRAVTVTVTDATENLQAPTLTGNATVSHPENGTTVATYSASDPEGATIFWLAPEGADARRFAISGGVLRFVEPPDFEKPDDGGSDHVYEVTVVASDGKLSDRLDVQVTVTNVDEPPVIRGLHEIETQENFAPFNAGWAAKDPEEATTTFTWSLSGTDAGDFDIDSATSTVTFKNVPNYEAPTDADGDNVYLVTVQADDGTSSDLGTFEVMITVTGVDEPPVISGPDSADVAENTTAVIGSYSASDPEGDTVGPLQLSGADAGPFELDAGVLSLVEALDHEDPKDVGEGNTYVVTLVAVAGSLVGMLDVTVTITGVNEPPVIRGHDEVMYQENSTTRCVGRYSASDPDHDTITWLDPTGTDAEDFRINSSGDLCFITAPDFDAPHDSDPDNVYLVTVNASDGSLTDMLAVTVTVTGVDEPPEITGDSSIDFVENGTGTVASYSARDPEGEPVTWEDLSGDDADEFNFDSTTGVLTFKTPPDYDVPTDDNGVDPDNVYLVIVNANDGGKTDMWHVMITVTGVDEPPVISGKTSIDFAENRTGTVGTYTATDPEDATVVWEALGGVDSGAFSFSNGALTFRTPPDHEAQSEYRLTLRASDGPNTGTLDVTITVSNAEEPGTLSLSSEQPETGSVLTAALTDPDEVRSTTWTWERSISRSDPWTAVTGAIDGLTTSVYTPTDADLNRYLRVTVEYTDGHDSDNNLSVVTAQAVREPPPVNYPPVFADASTTRSVPENSGEDVAVGDPVTATDANSDTLTYTLTSGDTDRFTVDDSAGQIWVAQGAALNHEPRISYSVTVTATDPSNESDSILVIITVTDVNEAPEPTDDTATILEDESVTVNVLTNDPDPEGDNLTVSLRNRPRNGSATVEPDGSITYTPNANYHGADSFTYRVFDDALYSVDATVTVTITSVNDAPEFLAAAGERSVAPGAQAGTNVGQPITATDAEGDTLTYELSGPDAASFGFDVRTAQIRVRSGTVLDPEVQPTYAVTVTATEVRTDALLPLTASVDVTITVTSAGPIGPIGPIGLPGPPPDPTPSDVDFEWTVTRDIEALDPGHDSPTGAWSNGTTLWITENGSGGGDAIYAYDLATGERVAEREFALDDRNRAPRGVWSDRVTLWVSDSGHNRLYAHDLESGERLPERDIELDRRNGAARGIWADADGQRLWVLDDHANAIFVYDLASGDLLAEYALDDDNDSPHGLWSDGVTIWVSNHDPRRLFAYRLPAPEERDEATEEDAPSLERVHDEEFTELSTANNNSPRGLWSDGEVMYVVDEGDDKVYSYNMPDAIDARLASLTLSGVDIGEFSSARTEYDGVTEAVVTETTVEAEALQRRTEVTIDPPDADGDEENGHQVVLEGVEEITVTVMSADGSRERVYRVRLGDPEREAAPEPWAHCLRGDVAAGFSLVVFEGGSVEELITCAESRDIVAFYALHAGVYVSYILEAPDFVNRSFAQLFPDGVPPLTPLVAGSDGPPSADPNAGDGALLPGPECLRGDIAEGFSLVVYAGGSVDELETCARNMDVTALYVLHDGAWISYILIAPEFVNRSFGDLFPDGLPPITPLVARSEKAAGN